MPQEAGVPRAWAAGRGRSCRASGTAGWAGEEEPAATVVWPHPLPRALPWAGSSAAGWGEARQFQGTGPRRISSCHAGLGGHALHQGAGRLRGPTLSRRLTPQDHRGGLSGRGPARAGGPGGILLTLASSALPRGAAVATLALALPPTLSRWSHCLGLPHREQSRLPGLGALCSPPNPWSELVPSGG